MPWLPLLLMLPPLAPADTLPAQARDTVRVPELTVTVTRHPEDLAQVPRAVGVVGRASLQQAQPTLGLDEALSRIPGVYVANRWNFSLDQRLSIRGFGSRANFGLRGVKVLLDGVPQTLPDGQSQLTNVEYAVLERVEVLRGASSALYGNASGGALLLESSPPGTAPLAADGLFEGGAAGSQKGMVRVTGRHGSVAGSLMLSRFVTDGFRQQSAADIRQLAAGVEWALSGATSVTARWLAGDTPRAENPGALTAAELAANPDSAPAVNILRGADKQVQQHQLSLRLRHQGERLAWSATVFGLWRDLVNPLATPPPGPFSLAAGTWNGIDRVARGLRADATWSFPSRLTVSAGLDLQQMRDDRRNVRSLGGTPTDSVLANQQERVLEVGPFVQVQWRTLDALTVDVGIRHDIVRFQVDDRHLTDGTDNSGERSMGASSANVGLGYRLGPAVQAYGQVATAFETPTTTELVATATAGIGFNTALAPQRSLSGEVGMRGRAGVATWELAVFRIRGRDAIVQQREVNGRAFFANAGRTRNQGLEAGVTLRTGALELQGAYTYAHYRFLEYRIRSGALVDTLDGNQLAGVPAHFARGGLRWRGPRGLTLQVEQALASALYADDANTIRVAGWGAGVTTLRADWAGAVGGVAVAPFAYLGNLFDRGHVGSVTINGANGRVFEPAPGRHLFLGARLGSPP